MLLLKQAYGLIVICERVVQPAMVARVQAEIVKHLPVLVFGRAAARKLTGGAAMHDFKAYTSVTPFQTKIESIR